MSKKNISGEIIYKFCLKRWDYYRNKDGAYLPSIHDKQVFDDASKEFNLPASACEYWFNKTDKPLAEKKVKEAIANGEIEKLCDEVVAGNGENPWGRQNILKNFYKMISVLKQDGIKNVYITVDKDEKTYCTSDNHLIESGFLGEIVFSQYENGDIRMLDDANNGFIFEISSLQSIIKEITDTDNAMVIAKKMFKLLMKNGNIVTVYFDFKN